MGVVREEAQRVKPRDGQQEAMVLPKEGGRRHRAWQGGVREPGEFAQVEQWVRCEKGHPFQDQDTAQHRTGTGG